MVQIGDGNLDENSDINLQLGTEFGTNEYILNNYIGATLAGNGDLVRR